MKALSYKSIVCASLAFFSLACCKKQEEPIHHTLVRYYPYEEAYIKFVASPSASSKLDLRAYKASYYLGRERRYLITDDSQSSAREQIIKVNALFVPAEYGLIDKEEFHNVFNFRHEQRHDGFGVDYFYRYHRGDMSVAIITGTPNGWMELIKIMCDGVTFYPKKDEQKRTYFEVPVTDSNPRIGALQVEPPKAQ